MSQKGLSHSRESHHLRKPLEEGRCVFVLGSASNCFVGKIEGTALRGIRKEGEKKRKKKGEIPHRQLWGERRKKERQTSYI